MSATQASTDLKHIRYLESSVEHALVFDRPDGDQVNMAIDHHGSHHSLTLAIFDQFDVEQPELRDQVIFSYQETRLLRDLLNRPEVSAMLEQD